MNTTAKVNKEGHVKQLAVVFCIWKVLLLTLAAFCPGPGYDTSALILLDLSIERHTSFSQAPLHDRFTLNLFRWDSIYFAKAAKRYKVHEQEWAFSWAYSKFIRFIAQVGTSVDADPQLQRCIVAGIAVSNFCHFLSVLVLYRLLTISLRSPQRYQIAYVGAVLHVLTPASLFLSAPYAEALFSLLNLTGMLHYAQSRTIAQDALPNIWEDAYKLSAGVLFGLATLMRSNGLLSGFVLLYDVARYLPEVVSMRLTAHDLRRIIVTCVSGSFVALGFVWPQYLAYAEFCAPNREPQGRLWCMSTVPSIYSWVQSHYWNVGLFRYWTLPNLPLFLMAAPMLWLLLESSAMVIRSSFQPPKRGRPVPQPGVTGVSKTTSRATHCFPELVIPQLVLSIAAITSFHVQIVNRISSGYPTWYLMVATWLVHGLSASSSKANLQQKSQWIVRGMIVYAIVQGMLFANFLPPA
ncbi:GPI mannosyltransferase 2 [Ophiobolus disseminans]|uniref:GPI mannosyltransferase 2 n=1 Tax=Ophiobolus disseminans TaxID=1469910 RepID=A0A6A7ACK6_9PLEO|nr:GPI mannosyltransferase 2 [Ophiobolus disseminans]